MRARGAMMGWMTQYTSPISMMMVSLATCISNMRLRKAVLSQAGTLLELVWFLGLPVTMKAPSHMMRQLEKTEGTNEGRAGASLPSSLMSMC